MYADVWEHVCGYICVLTCAGPYVLCVGAKWPFLWPPLLCYLTQSLIDPAGLLGQQFPAAYFCLPSNEVLSLGMQATAPGSFLWMPGIELRSWPTWPSRWSWIAIFQLNFMGYSLWKHEVTALVILATVDLIVYVQQIIAGKEYSALDACLVANQHSGTERPPPPWHIWALCVRKQKKQAVTPKWRLLTASRLASVCLPHLSLVGLPAFAGSASYLWSTLLYVL